MNAFSPIRIELNSSHGLLFLYLLTFLAGVLGLFRVDLNREALALSLCAYTVLFAILIWRDIVIPLSERISIIEWDVEHRQMQVMTGDGRWVKIKCLCESFSVPGAIQVLILQREDRYASTRLLLTPDRLSRDSARRLQVALSWSAPLEPHRAKGNWEA